MRSLAFTTFSDRWNQASYEVRVQGKTFLWGSAGLAQAMVFSQPLLLHVRNDIFGVTITLGTQAAPGTETTLGTLDPGECVSIPLTELSGVFATCEAESDVACLVRQ